jgi:GTP pyrophosphokinase
MSTDTAPTGEAASTIDFSAADAAFEQVIATVLKTRPNADAETMRAAYRMARDSHAGQVRRSGEPYITHPVAVTQLLAEIEMDVPVICAGLLHDVVEDTSVSLETIKEKFGPEVALLVDGVTKLAHVTSDPFAEDDPDTPESPEPDTPHDEARQKRKAETFKNAANLRKIFLAMARDMRVMVIKLADRLHNMRTLGAMSETKRHRIADETLQIYAPLAHRLGIWRIKSELEDLAFRWLEPEKYAEVEKLVRDSRDDRETEISEAMTLLREKLEAAGVHNPTITGRPKHIYSIYEKMRKQGLDFAEVFDLVALRVILHTRGECYSALGIVHSLWTPVPEGFGDYIARPKGNGYQSIHTKVIGPRGKLLEVQIRTWEMHRTAEYGVAAHFAYKEKGEGGKATDPFERKLAFLRHQLFEWQDDSRDSSEFLRSVTNDLFADQVFVFSPKGDVFDFPAGATPVDFGFRVHSDVGLHLVAAKINGRIVPLSYELKNGDVVELVTRSNSNPSRDWLSFAKTSHAKSKIKAYFKRIHHDESVLQGRQILQREADRLKLDAKTLLNDEHLRALAPGFNMPNEIELLAAVGYGTVAAGTVLHRLQPKDLPDKALLSVGKARSDERKLRISAGSVDNVMFRRSRCCLPIPGDEVVGYITRGRGMALHRGECPNVARFRETEPERLTSVEYTGGDTQVYSVQLVFVTLDRTGLLADVTSVFGEQKTFITAIRTQSHRDGTATLNIACEVKDTAHMNRLFLALRRLGDVLELQRAMGGKEK